MATVKKKKHKSKRTSGDSTSASDSSLRMDQDLLSDSSIISEHIISSNESLENDRSLQEIEIFNVPTDEELSRISQEDRPDFSGSADGTDGLDARDENPEVAREVMSILEEILRNEQFRSDSEKTPQRSNASYR